MKMLCAFAQRVALCITLLGGMTAQAEVIDPVEYSSPPGSALITEITNAGWEFWGSGNGLITSTSFFTIHPTNGNRFFRIRLDGSEEVANGEAGVLFGFSVFANDEVFVDYFARRLESFDSTHVDSYHIWGFLFSKEGALLGEPLVFAEGSSTDDLFVDFRTTSVIMPLGGFLMLDFHVFHEGGLVTPGKVFSLGFDNIRVNRAPPPASVPLPSAVLLLASALVAGIIGVRRHNV